MNSLFEELSWRGFVNQSTFTDPSDIDQPRTFYWGVDPSADSMTIGNLAAAMLVRHLIDYGHQAVLLVGGATGMIGDPDGKKQERDLKDAQIVERNVEALKRQYAQVFHDRHFEVVNNYDWFKEINYIEFLHQIGKHVSMTQLLDRDFVQARIGEGGSGISYGEFSYSLIQGYDFLHLYREHGVTLQVSGADQWGNCLTGVSLIRKLEGAEAHVFTTTLVVNKQTGVKFGKSEDGAIWLDSAKTSPYKFYQFWLNTDDLMAEDLIKLYTLLGRDEIEAIIENHRVNPGARSLQKVLAHQVTEMIHGVARRESVERVTSVLFGKSEFSELSEDDVEMMKHEIPVVDRGQSVSQSLFDSGLVKSLGEAKRLINGGGVSVNSQKITADEIINERSLLKKGKNSFVLID